MARGGTPLNLDAKSTYAPLVSSSKGASSTPNKGRATQQTPRLDLLLPGEPVALDIEFQKFQREGHAKQQHRVGRIAVVNTKKETIIDVFAAYPREDGIEKKWQPSIFGVTFKDLRYDQGAVPAAKVERWIKEIIKDRTVIVHGGQHDLTAFYIEQNVYANSHVEDTQHFYGQRGLKKLASDLLGREIQKVEHSPVEDAISTMELRLRVRPYDRAAELAKFEAERAAIEGPTVATFVEPDTENTGNKDKTGTKPFSAWIDNPQAFPTLR